MNPLALKGGTTRPRIKWTPLFLLALAACAGRPAVPPGKEPSEIPTEIPAEMWTKMPEMGPAPAEKDVFDPNSITEEVFNATKTDVQQFIGDLNNIIRTKDYKAWVDHLGEAYFSHISSPEYLGRISESARLKARQIRVSTPQEYFIHVVVPSRANDRVDDIEFVSPTRVKAFTITAKNQRLRLYDLEWSDNRWKIIN
jgi:hypothetical protein